MTSPSRQPLLPSASTGPGPDLEVGLGGRGGPATITARPLQSGRAPVPWGLGLALLLLLQACVMPPPEEEPIPNKPPTLEWKLTEPQGSWIIFNRLADSSLTFSVANAVVDPEGDRLSYIWFWRVPGGDPSPLSAWPATMNLTPCEEWALRSAKTVQITVVVSDRLIEYDRFLEDQTFPVVYEEAYPPLVREWTVEMLHACVN